MSVLLTAILSIANCKCYPWTSLLITLVALVASAQVYLPKIPNILVFHADKGAVVKETLVAMSVFVSCMRRIYLSNSFQTRSNRGPSNSRGPYKSKNAVEPGEMRKEWPYSLVPVWYVLSQPLTRVLNRLERNQKLASYMQSLDSENAHPHKEELQLGWNNSCKTPDSPDFLPPTAGVTFPMGKAASLPQTGLGPVES